MSLPAQFTLIDGTVVNSSDVVFTPPYEFALTDGTDITENMFTKDKLLYDNFDLTAYNNYLYTQKYESTHGGSQPPALGSTSTLSNFVTDVTTDPLAAPLNALDSGVKQVIGSTGIQTIVIIAVAGIAAVILFGPQFRKGLGIA